MSRYKRNQALKQISVLVPHEWNDVKKQMGVSWRVLIAKGISGGNEIPALKQEVEYFLSRAEKLHNENRELKARILKLELGNEK